jgi:hypothetical protein
VVEFVSNTTTKVSFQFQATNRVIITLEYVDIVTKQTVSCSFC